MDGPDHAPTVLAQPNAFAILFRCFRDRVQPACRVVRPSIAEYRAVRVTCTVRKDWRSSATKPAASLTQGKKVVSIDGHAETARFRCGCNPGLEPWGRQLDATVPPIRALRTIREAMGLDFSTLL